MCSGRVDLEFVFRALADGTDGVYIGGCHLGDCHYNTQGNYDAFKMTFLAQRILRHLGLNPERLRIEWTSAGEGIRFAEVMNDFGAKISELGPLGQSEGLNKETLALKLKAVTKLIPYLRVVQNERLRVKFDTEEEYRQFYHSEEFESIFDTLIADKINLSQIMLLLGEKSLSTEEIGAMLGLTASEVSRQLNNSATHGLAGYEPSQQRFSAL